MKENSTKKSIHKKRMFWVIIAILLFTIFVSTGCGNATASDTLQNPIQSEGTDNTQSGNNRSVPTEVSTVCRALTNIFVENVVNEEWHMLAFSIENFELDENDNGTIEVLYMPPNAGNGETKVNLTIEKDGDTYTITYALLAGVEEVDLSTVSNNYKTLTY